MSGLYRTLVGIIGVGAGVVSIGLSTGSPTPALVLLALSGFAQLGLALWVLAGRDVRSGFEAIALLPSLLWVGVAAYTHQPLSTTTFWLGLVLNVVLTVMVAVATRGQLARWEPKGGVTFLAIAALTGALMGFVATPALAASTAGAHAQKHGMGGMSQMSDTDMGSMPGMGH
jgi:hypothetical protein